MLEYVYSIQLNSESIPNIWILLKIQNQIKQIEIGKEKIQEACSLSVLKGQQKAKMIVDQDYCKKPSCMK